MNPQQAKDIYDAQGYVHIEKALRGDELKRIQTAFYKAEENSTLKDLLNQDDCFVNLVDHPAWLPIARAIVGDDVQLRYLRGGVIKPQSDSGSGWHCDLSGLRGIYLPDSIIMTKLFVYIDEVPEDGACIAFVPGSHRYELGHPLPDIESHEAMPHHVKMVVQAGDAVLMNGYTWHARFHNRSDQPRKVIESSYIHAWMKTQFEFAALSPHVQEQILSSHNRRQLFGVPEPGQTDWQRRLENSAPHQPVEVGI
ncbi:MAG: phytanoyl-CoA dioxygenase family protein [bacterium]|nr:phytanoyl-CoA dioxygenase family protein [bacterium]